MSTLMLHHSDWCELLLFVLAHFVWQAMLIVLLAGAIARGLHRERARVRYGVYLSALLAIIACPVVTAGFFSDSNLSTVAAAPNSFVVSTSEPLINVADRDEGASNHFVGEMSGFAETSSAEPAFDHTTGAVAPVEGQTVERVVTSSTQPTFHRASRSWVAGAYLLGVAFMLLRLLVSLASARNLRAWTFAIDDPDLLDRMERQVQRLRLRAAPLVRLSQMVVVPTIVGVFRPMILLPVTLITELTSDQLAAVVAHELAHIRRLDPLMNLLQRTTEVVFFFHPAVWLLSRWLTHERELACDEMVVSTGEPALSYAEALLCVAELGYPGNSSSHVNELLTLNAVRGKSALDLRVRKLLGVPATDRFRMTRSSTFGVVFSLVLAVTCSLLLADAPNGRILELSGSRVTGEIPESISVDDGEAGSRSRDTNPGESRSRSRHFVRLVIGPDRMTFQGEDTSWDQLETLLSELDDPEHTVLEIGDRDEAPSGPFGFSVANALKHMGSRAHGLAVRSGLESISNVGKSEYAAKGSPTQTIEVDIDSEKRIATAIEMARQLGDRLSVQVRIVAKTGKAYVAGREVERRGLSRILRAIPNREETNLEIVFVGENGIGDNDVRFFIAYSGFGHLGFKALFAVQGQHDAGLLASSKLSSSDQDVVLEEKVQSERAPTLIPPADLTPRELVNGFLDRLVEGKKTINGIHGSWDHAWAYTTRENGWGLEMQKIAGRPEFRATVHLASGTRAMVLTPTERSSVSSVQPRVGVFDLIRRDGRWLIQNMDLYKPENAWLIADGFARNDDVRWGILPGDIVGTYHSGFLVHTEFRFDADGTYTSKTPEAPQVSGTWRLEGDVLFRSIDGKETSNRINRFFDQGFVIEYGKRNRAGYYRIDKKNSVDDPSRDEAKKAADGDV